MRPETIIIDIDGVIIEHRGDLSRQITTNPRLLPGVLEKFNEWNLRGCHIVLMTGRKESMRSSTETTLSSLGVFWDQLVMGVTGGVRVLVNDRKPDGSVTAVAVNLPRNEGLDKCCWD